VLTVIASAGFGTAVTAAKIAPAIAVIIRYARIVVSLELFRFRSTKSRRWQNRHDSISRDSIDCNRHNSETMTRRSRKSSFVRRLAARRFRGW
jgi:hypothetical protein